MLSVRVARRRSVVSRTFCTKSFHFCHSEGGTTEESVQELKFDVLFVRDKIKHKILHCSEIEDST